MNKMKRVLCGILSMCLLSVPIAFSVTSTGAESIDSLEQQLRELEEQNKEYQEILDKTAEGLKDIT